MPAKFCGLTSPEERNCQPAAFSAVTPKMPSLAGGRAMFARFWAVGVSSIFNAASEMPVLHRVLTACYLYKARGDRGTPNPKPQTLNPKP